MTLLRRRPREVCRVWEEEVEGGVGESDAWESFFLSSPDGTADPRVEVADAPGPAAPHVQGDRRPRTVAALVALIATSVAAAVAVGLALRPTRRHVAAGRQIPALPRRPAATGTPVVRRRPPAVAAPGRRVRPTGPTTRPRRTVSRKPGSSLRGAPSAPAPAPRPVRPPAPERRARATEFAFEGAGR